MYDCVEATSQIIKGIYSKLIQTNSNDNDNDNGTDDRRPYKTKNNSIIYGVFTTSQNAIAGSAICAYTIDSIMDAFEGNFKSEINDVWKSVTTENLIIRPGKCVDDSRTLPPASIHFASKNTLMETVVPAIFNQPIMIRVNLKNRLTSIAVDAQIKDINGIPFDVLFVGTDDGYIIKFININSSVKMSKTASNNTNGNNNNGNGNGNSGNIDNNKPNIISESQALPSGMAVKELIISKKTNSVIVVGNGHIVSLPLYHCSKLLYCQ